MIKNILLSLFIICNLAFVISPILTHADFTITQPGNGGVKVTSQTGEGLVQTIIGNVIIIFFTVAGLGAVIMFLWGAIEWIMSAGDKEKLAKARGRIVNAIIGLVLIALAFVIIRIVGQIIGFNPLGNLILPNIGSTNSAQRECEGRGGSVFLESRIKSMFNKSRWTPLSSKSTLDNRALTSGLENH